MKIKSAIQSQLIENAAQNSFWSPEAAVVNRIGDWDSPESCDIKH